MVDERNDDVRSALVEIQRYLLDQIPPLTASDAIATLLHQPPVLLVRQIHGWAVEQSRFQSASLSDCFFHAVKKVHLFGALKLIERAEIDRYLEQLKPQVIELCPPDERDLLRTNLAALDHERSNLGATNLNITRGGEAQAAPQPQPRGFAGDAVARTARRFSLVIERLARLIPGAKPAAATSGAPAAVAPPPEPQQQQATAQLVTMAAASARSEKELEQYLESLRPYTGGEAEPDALLRILAKSIPQWEIAIPAEAGVKPPAPVEAMHKILTLTKTPTESTRRFRELLMTAVEQFNSGSLSAAVSMLELANLVMKEKKHDPSTVDRIRADAVDAVSAEQLRKYAENRNRHPLLRKAMTFFPTLTKESLFEQLRGEARPERRRTLLGLLEAYGPAARELALVELERELARPPADLDTYYLRNLIYLLHKIQREEGPLEKELELLTKSSARGQSIYVVKEAVMPLGTMKSDVAVRLLTMRLAELEAALLRKDSSLYPGAGEQGTVEMQKLVDRIVTALVRIATPAALLTVARHGMKPNPLLGDTRARLAALGQHDLSFDDETVTILINAIRDDLPTRILGRVILTRQPPLRLIEALASTRSERVEKLFREIADKFGDQELGRSAAAALANLSKSTTVGRETAGASLTGDLQFFGLPTLMQSLAETQATGIVTLSAKPSGQTTGKLLFLSGNFVDAQTGHLRGTDALYQLLERPVPGTFAFVPKPPADIKTKAEPQPVMGLLFEGIRRHDELNQAVMVVPDDLSLKATATKPTPAPDESDPSFIREVWVKATSGTRVSEWESQIATDAYRIRRLVAHWVEEGALVGT